MAEYIISEKALEDLNNIWIYTAENWSVEQANRYYNLIMDEIEFVSENFETTKDFGIIRNDYRYSKVKSHLIFCKRVENPEMEVIRILHEKMDVKNRIND
ncbi:type II toxin-antitoxin system RelE/ParE family toxin [Flavobacterium franklandianum]|uniref:Toxin n=2 Tax=Flavobacterium TaxID=237 RepID=A0A3S0M6F8_9FLAO|nr:MULTISPECIES: type II toxin-antitoxin system RelE/ParE family toxin [Flavobacterium]RTY96915.1 type II toxin-antitoxin system RelE/ParE family toxin [Flavobacterium bomense]TRX15867.1 type II toxin-antitoxin system RelE/ParE family toxin [Flavobacterium franklandianum]TRX25536.1 type II toxin-antitoxin system RelE/ParE family toxin [Flavobacterium franklandianum]